MTNQQPSPAGTADHGIYANNPAVPAGLENLTRTSPGVETPGYCREVPPGLLQLARPASAGNEECLFRHKFASTNSLAGQKVGRMSKGTKIIVGLTCLALALLHALLLAFLLSAKGEGRMLVPYLEYPLFWLESWMLPSQSGEALSPFLWYATLWIGGTLFYGLVVGVPLGFALVGIRRFFKWLNDDRWTRND